MREARAHSTQCSAVQCSGGAHTVSRWRTLEAVTGHTRISSHTHAPELTAHTYTSKLTHKSEAHSSQLTARTRNESKSKLPVTRHGITSVSRTSLARLLSSLAYRLSLSLSRLDTHGAPSTDTLQDELRVSLNSIPCKTRP